MSKEPLDSENKHTLSSGLISSIITKNLLSKNTLGLTLADSILKQSEISKKILYPNLSNLIVTSSKINHEKYNSGLFESILKQSELSKSILNSNVTSSILKQAEGIHKTVSLRIANSLITQIKDIEFANSMLKNIQEQSNLINANAIKIDKRFLENNSLPITETMMLWAETIEEAFTDGFQRNPQSAESSETESTSKQNKQPKANLNEKFASSLKALPVPAQVFLLWIIYQVLLASVNNYLQEKTLNQIYKAETYLTSLINDKPMSKTDIMKENKDIEWESLNKFRFITGDNVRLRATPSMNSEVIETIGKNTIVAILGNEGRQWLFVQVKSGDETITGWVTRTYTKPLKG
ncbi:SH3 domain-containing protein [Citrobacter freundii]|uniref:SH3 domain-containing protein n=1 Tax=Citrobacter freundii TaxID=546 RepID=UPI0037CC8734